MTKTKFWQMTSNSDSEATISIDGEIVSYKWDDADTTGASFRNDLNALGDVSTINLHINSPGGNVFEGISIYNQLKQNSAHINVYVDGVAASIASVIAMSGDTIFMPSNAMLLIHKPWTMISGNADALRKEADSLDRIGESSVTTYLDKTDGKISEDKLRQMMADETWLSATESVDYGFADQVIEANQMAACIPDNYKEMFHHLPDQLIQQDKNISTHREEMIQKAQLRSKNIKQILGGIF